ncbi:MAG: protein-methionine-sulfoxide reductase catalytic subunit MsrP [Anaerolineaceae bacterium]|nr:protein-methionine-sulfoxide reductase catalytic subunit MsrP [Anaerolineaceae bacterium]
MKSYQTVPVRSSEITPEHIYLNRRKFMQAAGAAATAALLAACAPQVQQAAPATANQATLAPTNQAADSAEMAVKGEKDELGDPLNTFEQITNYNNYYEFSFDKQAVAGAAKDFPVSPWEIKVGGLVNKPQTFSMEDILKQFPSEERIYRLRCVEAWSMVIPWMGFPLAKLLKAVEPQGSAKFVAFKTLLDETNMPNLAPGYPWPYTEGLRVDEAMNDLALLVTGLYGKQLPMQNGAPIRLAVPWKYGFKSVKSIVTIDLVEQMPDTLWPSIAPNEYGFYANVNPEVSHPRWSQSSERRIGEIGRRETLLFNGYADQVASMYTDEELKNKGNNSIFR